MNDTPKALAGLKAEYQRLRQSLVRIGYINQGSVQQRSVAALHQVFPGRGRER